MASQYHHINRSKTFKLELGYRQLFIIRIESLQYTGALPSNGALPPNGTLLPSLNLCPHSRADRLAKVMEEVDPTQSLAVDWHSCSSVCKQPRMVLFEVADV
uniref:Uncharacterized protein n=1 Tax=Ananas comosus var. bracteatus TaxID=296719 RepID=A0A6V7P2K3_ANACO|nr:unnamed protein product [Ananas comosus var. bracteatus]